MRLICGSSRTTDVTRTSCEVIKGIISTPTVSDFAWRKGSLLKFGSSAMTTSFNTTPPLSNETSILPMVTWRPTASLALLSTIGRSFSALIRKGIARMAMTMRATMLPKMIQSFFMERPLPAQNRGSRLCYAHCGWKKKLGGSSYSLSGGAHQRQCGHIIGLVSAKTGNVQAGSKSRRLFLMGFDRLQDHLAHSVGTGKPTMTQYVLHAIDPEIVIRALGLDDSARYEH